MSCKLAAVYCVNAPEPSDRKLTAIVLHAGEAAKKVSTLAFQRIRELQGAVKDSKLEVAAREERITQLEQRVAFLEHEARAAQVRGAMMHSLEVSWDRARLMGAPALHPNMQAAEKEQKRLAARFEELQRGLDKYRDSDAQLQDQIISLTDQRKSLHSEVSNLTGEVSSAAAVQSVSFASNANRAPLVL